MLEVITVGDMTIATKWLYMPIVFFVWLYILSLVKKIVFKKFSVHAEKTRNKIDDVLVSSLDLPLNIIIFISGLMLLKSFLEFNEQFHRIFILFLKSGIVISIILFLDGLFKGLVKNYGKQTELFKTSGGIIQGLARGVIFGIGLLIFLDSVGISITPVLASLGIGSLAVALALQDTLANFFSGLQIIIDKPVKAGQFVKLESGQEGYVDKVGWRSTHIRMLPNNIVVVPNSKLINSTIVNYYYPETEMSVLVQVGVHYDSDLSYVEKVTIEVGKEVLAKTTGGVETFEPFIRYHTFDDFSINFTVILRVKEFVDNYLIKHEFIKALHKRYKEEGIVIPYPIRTVEMVKE